MKDPKAPDTAPLAPPRPLTGPAQSAVAHAPPAPAQEQTRTFAPPVDATPRPPAHPPAPSGHEGSPGHGTAAPPAARPTPPTSAAPARARRARLRIVRVDPWSVMKMAFALSIAIAIVTVVAVAIVWTVLGAAGVWESINSSVESIIQDDRTNFDITEYVGLGRVLGLTMIIAVADVILITAIATLGAFLYNLAAALLGGLEVTLAENR